MQPRPVTAVALVGPDPEAALNWSAAVSRVYMLSLHDKHHHPAQAAARGAQVPGSMGGFGGSEAGGWDFGKLRQSSREAAKGGGVENGESNRKQAEVTVWGQWVRGTEEMEILTPW